MRSRPGLQCLAVSDAKLRNRICDMVFDGVETDAPAVRDLLVREAVSNGVHRAPFSWR